MNEIYLDNNATTQPLSSVCAAMIDALGPSFGNPSSAHEAGARTRLALQEARAAVAGLIGAREDQVIFTGSGTAANNLVLLSYAASPGSRIVTTEVEHSSIRNALAPLEDRGQEIIRLPISRTGRIELDALASALVTPSDLVTIHWINNETGAIQPIREIAMICQDRGVPFHTDAAQAVGKVEVNVSTLPICYLTCTAHKLHGPPGVGALVARDLGTLHPLMYGGPQERALYPGTENLPGIVGFGVAADRRRRHLGEVIDRLKALRDRFEQSLLTKLEDVKVNGDPNHRVCNTSNLLFQGTDGQALVARLDRAGLRCSQSSACTNQRPEPSYVLEAMGLTEEEAYGSVRFSLSELTTEDEVDRAVELIVREVEYLREIMDYAGAA